MIALFLRAFVRGTRGAGAVPGRRVTAVTEEVARDRVLSDEQLVRVSLAGRQIDGAYGGIVELLALTGGKLWRAKSLMGSTSLLAASRRLRPL